MASLLNDSGQESRSESFRQDIMSGLRDAIISILLLVGESKPQIQWQMCSNYMGRPIGERRKVSETYVTFTCLGSIMQLCLSHKSHS